MKRLNRKLRRLLFHCSCVSLCLPMLVNIASAANIEQRANAGIAALQNFYVPATGLYNSPGGWWQSANALETTIDFSVRTNTDLYTRNIPNTFNNNNNQNFLNNYYDDEGWWAITWIKAYDLTGNVAYLNAAKTIFKDMTGGWDNTCSGGIWWSKDRNYKNAIANELFLVVAARLHNRTPGDSGNGSYLDWAQREWSWFNASGMINGDNLINDGLTQSCQNNGNTTWTYNQGVVLGGLADLYKATGDATLLTKAETIAEAAIASPTLVNSDGILVEPCENSGCGNDGVQFKGIFAKNLYYLLATDKRADYRRFLNKNAASIWKNDRDSTNQFGLHWAGPMDAADGGRQSSAQDVLNSVLPPTSYLSVNAVRSSSFSVMTQTTGTHRLTFHFSMLPGQTASRTVLVDSVPVAANFSFSGASTNANDSTANLDISLTAGLHRITVGKTNGDGNTGSVQLQSLDVAPVGASFSRYEAENAGSNVGLESSNAGFTGIGYRCCWNNDGQYVAFSVDIKNPGAVQLLLHYAAGAGDASREIFVNGLPVNANLTFSGTGAWTNWSYVSLNANLREGINDITIYYASGAGSQNFINLDNLQVLH